jgi:hypothetical protein
MFSGIGESTLQNLNSEQLRWLNNIKCAVYQCDMAVQNNNVEDECLASLCRGVETAQKLRRWLQGTPRTELEKLSRKHFIEFIELDFPTRVVTVYGQAQNAPEMPHPPYSDMIYEIRCKAVHENENLNSLENPTSNVQIDWHLPEQVSGQTCGGVHFINGRFLAIRVRSILAKFVMGLDSIRSGQLNIHVFPSLGSIKPD